MSQQETGGLTLKELMTLVAKDFKIVLALALVGLVLGAAAAFTGIASSIMSHSYTVTMELAIVAQNDVGTYGYGRTEPGSEDVTAARNSIYTAARVVEGDQVLDAAISRLGLIGVTSDDLASRITANALKDSQVLTVTLVWDDPDEGIEIMNAIAAVTPQVLIDTLKLGNASVIDSPKVVDNGSGMSKNLMMVLVGLLAGLFVGIAIVVLRDMMFPKVVEPLAVRDVFGIKLMGAIPDDNTFPRRKGTLAALAEIPEGAIPDNHAFHESIVSTAHMVSHHVRSARKAAQEAPALEAVAGGAHARTAEGEGTKRAHRGRIIYVTSSVEQEGKSACTSHLAMELARIGWKTLLIDCDLRNPSIAPMFFDKSDEACRPQSPHSVNAIITRGVDPKDAVIEVTDKLHILPSAIEEQRITLDYRIAELCEDYADAYDIVLIDTPPVGQVSDAMTLTHVADDVLFVIRYNYATFQMIQGNLETLEQSGANVLGAIVTRIDTRFAELPRHYSKYSGRYSTGSGGKHAKGNGVYGGGKGTKTGDYPAYPAYPSAANDSAGFEADADDARGTKKGNLRGLHARSRR